MICSELFESSANWFHTSKMNHLAHTDKDDKELDRVMERSYRLRTYDHQYVGTIGNLIAYKYQEAKVCGKDLYKTRIHMAVTQFV